MHLVQNDLTQVKSENKKLSAQLKALKGTKWRKEFLNNKDTWASLSLPKPVYVSWSILILPFCKLAIADSNAAMQKDTANVAEHLQAPGGQ